MIGALVNGALALLAVPLWVLWIGRNYLIVTLFAAAFVFIGLPIQANQDVFWRQGERIFEQIRAMYDTVRVPVNALLECTSKFPVIWNRIAALIQGVLIVIADVLGYDLPRGVRDTRATPVIADVYCDFVAAVTKFVSLLLKLFSAAVFLLIDIIGGLIVAVAQIDSLEFVDLIVDLIQTVFEDLLGLRDCFSSWEGTLFCLCRGRWSSVAQVPSSFPAAFASCLNPGYDGSGDPFTSGFATIFGVNILTEALGALQGELSSLYYGMGNVATQAIELINDLLKIDKLVGTLKNLLSNIGKKLSDVFDSVLDWFSRSPHDVRRRENLQLLLRYHENVVADSQLRDRLLRATMDLSDAPRGPARRAAAFAAVRNATDNVLYRFVAELPGAWDRALAQASLSRAEARLWPAVLGVAREALAAPRPLSGQAVAARLRTSGADFSVLIPAPHEGRCAAAHAQRALLARSGVDGAWTTHLLGAVVVLAATVVLAVIFPPTVALIIGLVGLTALSTVLIFVSGNALHMASAIATGQFDQALGLATALYVTNYVGRAYMAGGLLTADANQFVAGLAHEIGLDAVYGLQLAADGAVCNGVVTPLCLPPPVRGENPLDRIVGALACEQGASCAAPSDCRGRAKACINGKCHCWLFMPTELALPELTFVFNQPLNCAPYGYTNDHLLLPTLSWGAVWDLTRAVARNAWAASGDLLAQLAHNKLPYAILGVAAAAFLPIVGKPAATMARYAAVALAAQAALAWANGGLGWIAPREHGWSCMVAASPSLVLGWTVVAWLAVLGGAVFASGLVAAAAAVVFGLLGGMGWLATALLRWAQPYRRWYNSGM